MVGKLFEDLDALAGNIAHNHNAGNGNEENVALVTASVDKIIQEQLLPIAHDLLLVGQVAWVGRSSIVVAIEIHLASLTSINPCYATVNSNATALEISNTDSIQSLFYSSQSKLFSSFFTYVARNRLTGKAALVNKLAPDTKQEKLLFSHRQHLAEQRSSANQSLDSTTKSHSTLTHLVDAGCALRDMPALCQANAVLMQYTSLENCLVCQPQNVNTSGKVFGGFIMHRAFDLALSTCYLFAGRYPIFLESDKISFQRPVSIGDLLRLKSRVVYSSDDSLTPKVVVEVSCQVMRPEQASSFVSNNFLFSFGFSSHQSLTLRKVFPVTIEEAQALVQGALSVHS